MTRHEMEITIDEKTGEVTFEAHGIKGRGCLSILNELIAAMGAEPTGTPTPTAEMREVAQTVTGIKGRR